MVFRPPEDGDKTIPQINDSIVAIARKIRAGIPGGNIFNNNNQMRSLSKRIFSRKIKENFTAKSFSCLKL